MVHWIFTKWWRLWDDPLNKVQNIRAILWAYLQLYSYSRWSLSPLCTSICILESLFTTKTPAGILNEIVLIWNIENFFRLVFFLSLILRRIQGKFIWAGNYAVCGGWGAGETDCNCKRNSFIRCGSVEFFWCFLCPFC